MAENKDYLVQEQENGSILISEEVIASIASLAVREVEGVYGLSMTQTLDLSNILGKKNLRKGIRVVITEEGVTISCNLIVKMGSAVMTAAQSVQRVTFSTKSCEAKPSAKSARQRGALSRSALPAKTASVNARAASRQATGGT